MSPDSPPAGMNHLTVVPENFDREEATCPSCGRPLSAH